MILKSTVPDHESRVIYDFGANIGLNLPYFLHKADLVVAVEANPDLTIALSQDFSDFISAGRLIIVNACLSPITSEAVSFYRHKTSSLLSQFPRPSNLSDFEEIFVPSLSPVDVISAYGKPYYIKIDIEHMDAMILQLILGNGITPPFISAECHDCKVLSILLGYYSAFKVVNGIHVGTTIRRTSIYSYWLKKTISHDFPDHSSGPFGDDIPGEWLSGNRFLRTFAVEGFGWVDLHCSLDEVSPNSFMSGRHFVLKVFKAFLVNSLLSFSPLRRKIIKALGSFSVAKKKRPRVKQDS